MVWSIQLARIVRRDRGSICRATGLELERYTFEKDRVAEIHAFGDLTAKIVAWPNRLNCQKFQSSNPKKPPRSTPCPRGPRPIERPCVSRVGRWRRTMPLVSRDPGGWMSPRNQKPEKKPRPVLTARSEPVGHPTISPTGSPAMPYGRIALIGLQ